MANPNEREIKYSVIILIYHRTQEMVDMGMECLASVINSCNRDETEIILVDNGSTVRHDWEKNVDTYVRLNQNYGISRGWNTGLRLAKGQYINVLGDDTKVRSGWLEALQEAIDQPNAGVSNIHVQNLPVGKGIIENYKWFSGACFMLTPKTLEKVGYFREDLYFPANFEDSDYWTRVYKAGLKLYVNYGMSIFHREGATVHAPDIGVHFMRLARIFAKEHGFSAQDVFNGSTNIYDAIKVNAPVHESHHGMVDTPKTD